MRTMKLRRDLTGDCGSSPVCHFLAHSIASPYTRTRLAHAQCCPFCIKHRHPPAYPSRSMLMSNRDTYPSQPFPLALHQRPAEPRLPAYRSPVHLAEPHPPAYRSRSMLVSRGPSRKSACSSSMEAVRCAYRSARGRRVGSNLVIVCAYHSTGTESRIVLRDMARGNVVPKGKQQSFLSTRCDGGQDCGAADPPVRMCRRGCGSTLACVGCSALMLASCRSNSDCMKAKRGRTADYDKGHSA